MEFFLAESIPVTMKPPRPKKAVFPFKQMAANPGTGFVIPADRADLFSYCRAMASMYNGRHGTFIRCSKQADGSLKVWSDKPETPTAELLEASISIANKHNEQTAKVSKSDQPTKEQFQTWINDSLQPGMSYTFQREYAHRFDEFKLWASEIPNCETEIEFNPPKLKISRKGSK